MAQSDCGVSIFLSYRILFCNYGLLMWLADLRTNDKIGCIKPAEQKVHHDATRPISALHW